MDIAFQPEVVRLAELKPHPRNYRQHPEDQLAHLMASIKEHGLYRNVVVAAENTILAGHGVVQALAKLGYETVSVIRMDVAPDSTAALKVLTGDNEIDHLAVLDDRMLTEILKDLQQAEALVGTGYDDMMLANLLLVTRPAEEVADIDEAAQWVGMPEFEPIMRKKFMIVGFRDEAAREDFGRLIGMKLTPKTKSVVWPLQENEDLASVRVDQTKA